MILKSKKISLAKMTFSRNKLKVKLFSVILLPGVALMAKFMYFILAWEAFWRNPKDLIRVATLLGVSLRVPYMRKPRGYP
jgi:hypothetical protein